MSEHWLVDLRCTRCGAPGKFLGEQLIAICQYCGHVISAHRVLSAGHENLAAAEIRSFVVPTLTDVRRLELSDLRAAALARRDAEVMYAATLELTALDAIEAGLPREAVATWARWSAAVEHVATFDDRGRSGRRFAPSVEQFTADPAGYLADALAQQTRVYVDVISSPAFPVELAPAIPPEVAAMDAILACLRAWVMFAPFDAFTRGLRALGQRPIVAAGRPLPCTTCGAPLAAAALATLACEYCRSALEVRQHLWLASLLRIVAMSNLDTLRADERAAAALGMLTAAMRVPDNQVPEEIVVAYVEALEGIERGAMAAMLALMLEHHALGPAERAVLRIVERHLDRIPLAVPPQHQLVALPPSEAWRRAMQRNWRRMQTYASVPAEQRALVAANQLLPALAGGYLPDPDDAAAFLGWTGVDLAQLRAALALHRMGEDDPDKAAFWDATKAALERYAGSR